MTELEKKLETGYKRLAIVSIIWSLLAMPFVFFIPKNSLSFFVIFWLIWIIIGILLSPKIVIKIWKQNDTTIR